MSSKASGEPCLMLSAGVLAALQNAVAAARAEVSGTSKVHQDLGLWCSVTAADCAASITGCALKEGCVLGLFWPP